jgi:hypothetical protein
MGGGFDVSSGAGAILTDLCGAGRAEKPVFCGRKKKMRFAASGFAGNFAQIWHDFRYRKPLNIYMRYR